jgi:hypothetical protein
VSGLPVGRILKTTSGLVSVALNLLPFAGIAFLGLSVRCVIGWASSKTNFLQRCFPAAAVVGRIA